MARSLGIGKCAMTGRHGSPQGVCHRSQAVIRKTGCQSASQRKGVDCPLPESPSSQSLQFIVEKADIERRVMSYYHRALEELEQFGHHLLDARCIGHHLVSDACDLGDHRGDRTLRVYEGPEMSDLPKTLYAHCPDFSDLAGAGAGAGGLEVESDERHVGQVEVWNLPMRKRQMAGLSTLPTETAVLPDESGQDLEADRWRSAG